ncbi:MAG: AAA family ATPase [Eubacteriales bacterium]|nr:AAA family ATPase [Eubacteriales bacterium]
MRLTRAKVSNYRNIDGITVFFNPDCNYIIGENNLGKSNFLVLLDTLFSGRKGFDEKEFADPAKPINIELDIRLLPSEQGFFEDNFSPEDSSLLKIRYQQNIGDVYPTIVSVDTNETISAKMLKKINFLKYETTSVPSKELRFDNPKGAGLLIGGIIERFMTDGDHDFLNAEQVGGVLNYINTHLGKIRSFRDYSIKATIAPNQTDMLSSLIYLSDGERKIDSTGSGVQYMTMASINILCQIMEIYKSKSAPFVEQLYTDGDGKKLLPLVLSIDEPEVHLHPYLQRSLIGYYKKILCNEDPEFTELLKLCFSIDGLDGQLIIVTHSTDALVGDYRNLIRFYKNGTKTEVVNGYALRPITTGSNARRIKPEDEKHIIMHFPEIKEAFYAKCAILIEGETEFGCIPSFAEKMGISLDDYGICVINARGEGTINPLRHILKLFAIPSIAIYDGDVMGKRRPPADEFFTSEKCFEIEIVKTLILNNKHALIRQIARDLDYKSESHVLDRDFLKDGFKKQSYDDALYTPKKLTQLTEGSEEFSAVYAAWFINKKGVLLGRLIGDALTAELIPKCYSDAIRMAQEVAASVQY